jgi:hypothetical protein
MIPAENMQETFAAPDKTSALLLLACVVPVIMFRPTKSAVG